jgi:hypothetical protein
MLRFITAPFRWLGRILLWIVFLPLGIWRSIRHGRKASERKILREIERRQPPT